MPQKSNIESFIKRAKEIHGDKYNYSKVEYVNNYTKVEIICPEHGSFFTSPSTHIHSKSRCPKCATISQAKLLFLSQDKFIKKAIKIHGDKYDYSKSLYSGALNKLEIICKESDHGSFYQQASNHLSGRGCPKCVGRLRTTELFIKQAVKIHGNKYDYSKSVFTKTKNKVTITCNLHGDFLKNAGDHLSKKMGCPKCGYYKLSEKGNNWKYSDWKLSAEKSKNFDGYKVYIVKLNDTETGETFFKIGKTFVKLVQRFKNIPYQITLLRSYNFVCAKECSEFETSQKRPINHIDILP